MDWYLDTSDRSAVTTLRRDAADYLRRHAAPGCDLAAAELAIAELLANAVLHAGGPAWVHIDWTGSAPILRVHDLGAGFELGEPRLPDDPFSTGGRGLYLVSHLTPRLSVAAKRAGGTIVEVELPLTRPAERSYDPERRPGGLPLPSEADEGTFGKEPFLRALVVQLAQHVEREHGPAAAEAAVAQIGTDVGGRMEEEWRAARGIVDQMTPEQMGELYVGLKRAIDGDFYVIEASPERIVLGNRACPFGEVVKRAPALCRMTSSVFGGIAARNAGGAAVQLEERIAVGDPECRVVVWLAPAEEHPAAHVYDEPDRVA